METASVVSADKASSVPPGASWGAHLGATLALGSPLVGAQLAQMAIHVTDTLMVGRLGTTELAAAVLCTQGFYLVWIFGSGFAQGLLPLAASAEGRGDRAGVRRSVRMGFWALGAYGLLMLVPLWHFEAILLALGQEAETARLAGSFMRVFEWGLIPALFIAGFRSGLSVVGRAGTILLVTLASVVLNAALNWVLIFGHFGFPALGLNGSALASVLTNVLGALALFAYCRWARGLEDYRFLQRIWRPDWPAFREILRIGLPVSTTIIAEAGLFAASSVMMGWLGTVTLAAHGIALQLASIAFMVPLGLSQAASVRVGVAFGRRDWLGLGRAAWSAIGLGFAAGCCGAILFWAAPGFLVGAYLDKSHAESPAMLAEGVQLLAVAAAFQLVDCLQVVSAGVLRGLADTRVPMIMALVSYWGIGMPVAWVLAFTAGLGGVGIWAGLAAGLFFAAVMMTARVAMRARLGLTPA
ncbi:MATE family efflux transporter [Aureimonas psammosilenae]|uniref:MATE family efflux transporter n=1 Tax=Aureimonas psammosilenae TaxID=2495496 RepID=UPI00126058F4|nr:MATE family efflux transporter [Aureimonas psammosilenae]